MSASAGPNDTAKMSSTEFIPRALIDETTRIKVSSTLDKTVGKKNLTDRSAETCWTSTQGLPQSIQVAFESPVIPTAISLTFQGGFAGIRCAIHVQAGKSSPAVWNLWTNIYPEDVNRRQTFELPPLPSSQPSISQLKLVFEESSDLFGRITIYDLAIDGLRAKVE
ncbi:hypothetical protein FRC03_008011 [Tulasnella sp. 419]|nr:hypothetical protein FRC03_008011 [Tulasnella sp. 419]